MEYKVINQKAFEKIESFEKRLNTMAAQGWQVITSYNHGTYLILGRKKH